jgi:hypothetical protein
MLEGVTMGVVRHAGRCNNGRRVSANMFKTLEAQRVRAIGSARTSVQRGRKDKSGQLCGSSATAEAVQAAIQASQS